ncbi:hypothetical protein B5S28_g596 [[Candida] boidinii]|nr:hypothetical protein B5S28_g596 [[Candida] boidinii]OWB79851.1 hypothetical protein B5S32_g4090 [[Candida] boidinii]
MSKSRKSVKAVPTGLKSKISKGSEESSGFFEYKKGKDREYLVSSPNAKQQSLLTLSKTQRIQFVVLVAFTLIIRLYNLKYPDSVVFDETHFGGFASKYIKRRYFFDVHPPLVKMLYGLIGALAGYRGDFEFKPIGLKYLNEDGEQLAPYIVMRTFPAICGIATVILAYRTLRASGCRHYIAIFGAFLVAIENSLVTQSRYIFLDAPLLFFIALTVAMYKTSDVQKPFSFSWYTSIIATGIALGCAASSKWVGLFTFAWLGLVTVRKMWYIFGDLDLTPFDIFRQFAIRINAYIVIPAIFYLAMFGIHFEVLKYMSDSPGLMTPNFQATLIGNNLNDVNYDVSYGSTVAMKHYINGDFLHSHDLYYEKTKNQEVTLYGYQDHNNRFVIEPSNVSQMADVFNTTKAVLSGAQIRLHHTTSDKYLGVTEEKPAMADYDYNKEVTCAKYNFDDPAAEANKMFNFEIRIAKRYSKEDEPQKVIKSIDTVFQLYNRHRNCYLAATQVKLPKNVGSGQTEVFCIENPNIEFSLFFIESNTHPALPSNAKKANIEPLTFLGKFLEAHKTMWRVNAGLTEEHIFSSRPDDWPFLHRGVNYWGEENKNVYYLGNFVLYWCSTISLIIYVVTKVLVLIVRKPTDIFSQVVSDSYNFYEIAGLEYFLGWFIHIFPSFLMQRQLFLHHYLPSLYFALLLLAQTFEFITSKNKTIGYSLVVAFALVSLYVSYHYAPLVYGLDWTKEMCKSSKIRDSWDIFCENYKN